jgi:hypothetical protein
MLEAALRYARLGLHVVPVVGKQPRASRGYASATKDPEELRRMFAAVRSTGVGIAAGAGYVLVDVDVEAALPELGGSLPETLTCRSGGGGLHLYYARPPGLQLSFRRDRLPQGVEVKLGAGGCVAPPSVHPDTGVRYRWERWERPAAAPAWLLDLLRCEARASSAVVVAAGAGDTRYGRVALERHARLVATAVEGARQSTLNGSAFALAQLVPSGHLRAQTIAEALAEAAAATGLPPREIRATIARAIRDGIQRPYLPERDR